MKYELSNPNKFAVPVFLDDPEGDFKRIVIPSRQKVVINENQISDIIKNLTSAPRYLLRIRSIKG